MKVKSDYIIYVEMSSNQAMPYIYIATLHRISLIVCSHYKYMESSAPHNDLHGHILCKLLLWCCLARSPSLISTQVPVTVTCLVSPETIIFYSLIIILSKKNSDICSVNPMQFPWSRAL